jgi:hypothetical protein
MKLIIKFIVIHKKITIWNSIQKVLVEENFFKQLR